MDPSIKFFIVVLFLVGVGSLFLPIMTNPNPVICDNYPDGTGGYYLKCKDDHITLLQKLRLPKNTPVTKQREF